VVLEADFDGTENLAPTEIDPRIIELVASRYTNYAISASVENE
jgi:hypothetical protein